MRRPGLMRSSFELPVGASLQAPSQLRHNIRYDSGQVALSTCFRVTFLRLLAAPEHPCGPYIGIGLPGASLSASEDRATVGSGHHDAKITQRRHSLSRYSINSSACTSNLLGTVRPSAFAVFRLMTSSNLVGCMTGRSAGFSPLRMRPVYMPHCRPMPGILGPKLISPPISV